MVVNTVVRRRKRSIRKGIELDFLACLQQWLVKIRRDVGPHFKLSGTTKVCSLHFYESDINKGLNIVKTQVISLRIHVERTINKITNLRDFKTSFPLQRRSMCFSSFCKFPLEVSSIRLGLLFRPQLVAVVLLMIHTNPVVILPSFR